MLRREILGIPIGIWLGSVLYALVCILLRSYYIDYEGLRQIAAVSEGISRASTTWWSGQSALGVLLLWLVTLPLRLRCHWWTRRKSWARSASGRRGLSCSEYCG
jgi:hypothetical protein